MPGMKSLQVQVGAADGRGSDLQDNVLLQMVNMTCSQALHMSVRRHAVNRMFESAFPHDVKINAKLGIIGSTYILGDGGLWNLDDLRMQ